MRGCHLYLWIRSIGCRVIGHVGCWVIGYVIIGWVVGWVIGYVIIGWVIRSRVTLSGVSCIIWSRVIGCIIWSRVVGCIIWSRVISCIIWSRVVVGCVTLCCIIGACLCAISTIEGLIERALRIVNSIIIYIKANAL